MAISEAQLSTWTHQGAVVSSARTYASIQAAVEAFAWPEETRREVYLQGSYRNSTNIRGDSDVDVVVELVTTFTHNPLSEEELDQLQLQPATYRWHEFKADLISALRSYYGAASVDTSGSKAIRVIGDGGNRLHADVLACETYQHYIGLVRTHQGIAFWDREGRKVINFPKHHYLSGSAKNSPERTREQYKQAVRMFKHARNAAGVDAPSYFLECFLSNADDWAFAQGSWQDIYLEVLRNLLDRLSQAEMMMCQNGLLPLFGDLPEQWSLDAAFDLVRAFVDLYRDW